MPTIDIAGLSLKERLDLIGDLCDSLEEAELPLSEQLKAELDRRNAGFAEDRAHAAPWSEVRDRLRQPRS